MNLDNNVPDINISNSNNTTPPVTTVQEIYVMEGDTAGHTFYVWLPFQPAYSMTVNIDEQPGGDASIHLDTDPNTAGDQHTLTFTTANWNTPQAVQVWSDTDTNDINGTASYYISAIGYSVQAITVTQIDGDGSPVVLQSNTLSVPQGQFELVPIKLAYQPISDVTVTATPESGADANITATPTTFTFTAANWYIPQTMVVYDAPGDVAGTATFDLVATTPTSEGTTTPVTTFMTTKLDVTETDYGPPCSLPPMPCKSSKDRPALFTVMLPSAPSSNVTVTIARLAGGNANLSSIITTLTFTPSNWNTPQAVKIPDVSTPETTYTTDGSAQFLISAAGYANAAVSATEINHITPKTTDAYGNLPVIDTIPVQGIRPLGNAFRVNYFYAQHAVPGLGRHGL